MLNDVLAIVRDQLENALQLLYPQAESWVKFGNVGQNDDDSAQASINKLVISLVSLQNNDNIGSLAQSRLGGDDRYYTGYPPLLLDAYFMVAANFTSANYEAALSRLSAVIYYFQQTPVFTRDTIPTLPATVDKLAVEFVSLDFAQMGHLLSATGSKYLPLVLYRLRRVPFVGASTGGVAPAVRSIGRGHEAGEA
jgi:hypothetical protein